MHWKKVVIVRSHTQAYQGSPGVTAILRVSTAMCGEEKGRERRRKRRGRGEQGESKYPSEQQDVRGKGIRN